LTVFLSKYRASKRELRLNLKNKAVPIALGGESIQKDIFV
jgi:hypothetical protein